MTAFDPAPFECEERSCAARVAWQGLCEECALEAALDWLGCRGADDRSKIQRVAQRSDPRSRPMKALNVAERLAAKSPIARTRARREKP